MFLRTILRETLEAESCLVVMGAGLGLEQLYSLLVRFYSTKRHLVLFLNVDKEDADQLAGWAQGDASVERKPRVIHSEAGPERARIYAQGGVIFVSARILVVDLLRRLVPFHLVTGVLVNGAHSIEDHGALAFSLRLLRFHCPSSTFFIKGFTENVQQLRSSARLEHSLRALFTGKALLYPRFEARISDELGRNPPEVVELCPPLSPLVQRIWRALQQLVLAIVNELCKTHNAIELHPLPTLENALLEHWSSLVSDQLMGQWQNASAKTKQLIRDLGLLRKTSYHVLQYDCVMFNRYLETLRFESIGEHSTWMFTEAADELFQCARARVLDTSTGDLVLECNPKWSELHAVLREIRTQQAEQGGGARSAVMIVVRDERSAAQVAGVLEHGAKAWLAHQWAVSVEQKMYKTDEGNAAKQGNYMRYAQSRAESGKKKAKSSNTRKSPPAARRGAPSLAASVVDLVKSIAENASVAAPSNALPAPTGVPSVAAAARREMFERSFAPVLDDAVFIHSLDGSSKAGSLLRSLRPKYVVAYDADLAFLRTVECYKSSYEGSGRPMRVYLIAHEEEESQERGDLEAENRAFEEVIHAKASMIVEDERGTAVRAEPAIATSSRVAVHFESSSSGGDGERRPYVVVDTREFNGAKVPSKLWCDGFDVEPVTLEIGDYIISDEVCIERKTVSDLISSFADGRLFKQCQNMQQHYAMPVLLIEFSPRAFYLQPRHEITPHVQLDALSSKLALLVLHFPKLRILWSRDLSQTIAFFVALRKGLLTGPNLDRIRSSAVDAVREDNIAVDATAQIFLSRLPGVLSGNSAAIAKKAGTLHNLFTQWNEAEYAAVMGKDNAALLGRFMRTAYGNSQSEGDDHRKNKK